MELLFYVPIFGKLFPVSHTSLEEGVCGSFDGNKILINSSIKHSNPLFKETLIHELGHALFFRCGLSQSPGITIDLEEIIVEQFAKLFCEAFTFYLKPEYKKFPKDN